MGLDAVMARSEYLNHIIYISINSLVCLLCYWAGHLNMSRATAAGALAGVTEALANCPFEVRPNMGRAAI